MYSRSLSLLMLLSTAMCAGCYTEHVVKAETVHEIKPIHITIDVNIKVDQSLKNYFEDLDKMEADLSGAKSSDSVTEVDKPTSTDVK